MKTRTSLKPIENDRRSASEPVTTRPNRTSIAHELATIRVALDHAREQISVEVKRREEAEQEFERTVTAERERVRKKLHDGLGQTLTTMCFLAASLRMRLRQQGITELAELDEMAALLNQAIGESRSIAASCDTTKRVSASA